MIKHKTFVSARAVALVLGATLFASGKAAADQVIPDDLIVQGSTCTGFDCVNNMAFNFDTLVLSENNLRIFFDDTSVSAGFPANKWRLTANDSASGGASFFSIDDATANRSVFKVTAGAPANSLFVSSHRQCRHRHRCAGSRSHDHHKRHAGAPPRAERQPAASRRRPGTSPATRRTSSCAT